ncbi:mirror-image polydactyly gene 1 protein [Hippocampus zosterae]|uniref:mirror-image polydactyly gene 1 protein n=1 Tax=Hippocampus zosterae TaxID=109293 RepID=UPI00223E67FA|nr:mirror-image polydactyly gene 1 protein [Hippocampus zosterae]
MSGATVATTCPFSHCTPRIRVLCAMKPKKHCSHSNTKVPQSSEHSTWTPGTELSDSLVDIYTDNPQVTEELRRRLPSPAQRSSAEPPADLAVLQVPPLAPRTGATPPPAHRRTPYPASSRTLAGGTDMEAEFSATGGSPSGPETSGGSGGPTVGGLFVSSHGDAATYGQAPPPDTDKKVSLLLRELDALRDANKKLLEQLSLKEEELQRKEAEPMADAKRAQDWEAPSAFLDELLSARKTRDEAMMARVLLANEERDEALRHVARLQRAAESDWPSASALGDGDSEAAELLERVRTSASAQEVARFGRALVERVRASSRRRGDVAAQEMRAVMEQRDASHAKCRHLQQEVLREREQGGAKEELTKLRQERDTALDDRKRLEAELERLEAELERLRAQRSPERPAEAPPAADGQPPRSPPLLTQLRRLTEDKLDVEAELRRCRKAERDASENVRRLERLVEVLRKKVGTGSLRAVV